MMKGRRDHVKSKIQISKKGKAQVFRDARLNEDFSIQVRDDRFILTDASDEVGDEWVDVDMAMPDAIEGTGLGMSITRSLHRRAHEIEKEYIS